MIKFKQGEYLTVKEAADMMHLSPSQVRRYCNAGKLVAMRVGKVWLLKEKDIAFMELQRTNKRKEKTHGSNQ
jgi:excisionase family DNA binding protein